MRHALLAVLAAVLLGSASLAQGPGGVTHRSDRFTITLPASFQAATSRPTPQADGTRLTIRLFHDVATRRLVVVTSVSGLSVWQRFAYRRGIGFSGSSNYSVDRVPLSSLPLSESIADLAGVAYAGVEDDGRTAGVLVRGCDGNTCFEVAAQGPAAGGEVARLLSGVSIRR